METKDTEDMGARFGWRDALATFAGGACFCIGSLLACSEPADGGPMTWRFILITKVGGLALFALTGWIYRRFIKGRDGDDDRA